MNWSGAFSTAGRRGRGAGQVHRPLQAAEAQLAVPRDLLGALERAPGSCPSTSSRGVEDVLTYDFNPPVGLGPYTLHSFDPNGTWYIWEKRADWDHTAVADFGEPAPQFVIYRNNMSIDNRLIEMRNGDLDMIHDLSPEGMFSIVKEDATVTGWFPGFPYAHPDPTLPMFIFNHQNPKFQDKRVRWALALMLDARGMSMAQLSRCGDALGDLDPAHRHASGRLSHPDAGVADQLRARHRRTRRSSRTTPTSASRSPKWCVRSSATRCRPTRTPSATPSATAGGSRTSTRRPSCSAAPASPRTATSG